MNPRSRNVGTRPLCDSWGNSESSLKQLQGFQEDDFLCVLLGLITNSEMASVQLKIFWLKARAPCLKQSSFLEESVIPKSSAGE